jgi:hypothetical protein
LDDDPRRNRAVHPSADAGVLRRLKREMGELLA